MHAQNILCQPNRVGKRHQHNLAANQPAFFQHLQLAFERMGHQHGRDFIGMERGLDIGFGANTRRAKAQHLQRVVVARHAWHQINRKGLHAEKNLEGKRGFSQIAWAIKNFSKP